MRTPSLALALVLAGPVTAQDAGIRLEQLPALARARHARVRPQQEAALAPFLADFELDPSLPVNRDYLERRVGEAAALGDGVVSLLLERLTPADDSPKARFLAANCAAVLARLDPGGFVQALIDLAGGSNPTARRHAISLLGGSGSSAAGEFLVGRLPHLQGEHRVLAIDALRRLRYRPAAEPVLDELAARDPDLRAAVLLFLTALDVRGAKPRVITSLEAEEGVALAPLYWQYFRRCAARDADAALALLRLLGDDRLTAGRRLELIEVLAEVAPADHQPTLDRLRGIIEGGELHLLGRATALTMLALGDKSGRRLLMEALDREVKKNPRLAMVLANRADALFAFERWGDGLRDYQEALRHTRSTAVRKALQEMIGRCQIRLRQYRRAIQAFREAGVTADDLAGLAATDPVLRDALETQRDLRSFVRSLGR